MPRIIKINKKKFLYGFFLLILIAPTFKLHATNGIHTYQKTVHLIPLYKQQLEKDIAEYQQAENLWDALREQFTLNHFEENPLVQAKILWYMRNPDHLLRATTRAQPYLFYILQQVRQRHLPAEIVLLPIVESEYNPFSLSNMGAAGIWQLMPGTALGYGVKQDWWYDGRRDVIASTRGALNYLSYLQNFFDGNWLLAFAAYNTGEGNVLAARRRNLRVNKPTNYWSLPLAQQTRDYVPSILALAAIISHPEKYPLYFPPVKNAPYLGQIDLGTQINLRYAAMLAGLSYQKMLQLNSGFTQVSTSAKGPYKIVLPIENIAEFTFNYARLPVQQRNTWIHYKVKPGDTFASLSRKFLSSYMEIKKFNNLGQNNLQPGSTLLIPTRGVLAEVNSVQDNPAQALYKKSQAILLAAQHKKFMRKISKLPLQASNKINYQLQPGDTIYMVRANDSLDSIALRFNSTPEVLRVANKLANNIISPGIKLIIPTHLPSIDAKSISATHRIQPGDTIYMVRTGDTVEKIANKFQVAAAVIRLSNLLDNNSLIVGEKLIIPTHVSRG